MEGRTDVRTDQWKDGRMYERTDGLADSRKCTSIEDDVLFFLLLLHRPDRMGGAPERPRKRRSRKRRGRRFPTTRPKMVEIGDGGGCGGGGAQLAER